METALQREKPKTGSEIRITALVAAALLMSTLPEYAVGQAQSGALAPPEHFAAIGTPAARSMAMFTELGKVLTHPRCVNCHPAGDSPRQGDQGRVHQPPVRRGADRHGLPTMRCNIVHHNANFDRVPGRPEWRLAPREMGCEGKTLAEICAQIKDPARNGRWSLQDLVHHIGSDMLVGWAWAPGPGRQPAPGTQDVPHQHPANFIYALSGGKLQAQNASGLQPPQEITADFTRRCRSMRSLTWVTQQRVFW